MAGTITATVRAASRAGIEPFTRPIGVSTPGSRYDAALYGAGRYDDPGSSGATSTFGTAMTTDRPKGTVTAS